MKKALMLLLCLSMSLALFSCNQEDGAEYAKEESGGSGFGVVKKSIITVSDLYFFSVNTNREQVEAALGSPQEYMISEDGAVTYRLENGAVLQLTYNQQGKVKDARFTDEVGKKWNLFDYLVELEVLKSASSTSQGGNTGMGESVSGDANQKPDSDKPSSGNQDSEKEENPAESGGYFSAKRYSRDIASKILKEGVKREKVLSALGKPNSFSSITFQKESYLIDAYSMEDGSIYYLDYGYTREKLRAVRCVKGSSISVVLGEWGQQERPKDFYYTTRNLNAFQSLKKGTKPSELYRRFGEPDWYEGDSSRYQDAYQLMDGSVLYLDFGNGHSGLSAATVKDEKGALRPYTLR